MIKKILSTVSIVHASINDYPVIQNMARFYVYDISRYCGFISKIWEIPADGLYECFDSITYFDVADRHSFLIKVDEELAGFAIVDKEVKNKNADWNIDEFFILAKFQGKNVGKYVAREVFAKFPGHWEVSVLPQNTLALKFWQNAIPYPYVEAVVDVDYDQDQPQRIVLSFISS
jgi:predicted acetyltransferase